MGTAIAIREASATVEGTPTDGVPLRAELRDLAVTLKVEHVLEAGRVAPQLPERFGKPDFLLLSLDIDTKSLSVRSFDRATAMTEYAEIERTLSDQTDAVLVSVKSAQELERAFPNYFWDTEVFLQAMKEEIA